MFAGCQSLSSLNLSSFSTQSVTSFESMFEDCESLASLNLENFVNYKSYNFKKFFKNCVNLEYVNIKNIKGYYYKEYESLCSVISSYCSTYEEMFSGCINLAYINIYSLQELPVYSNMFKDITREITYCTSNQTAIPNILSQIQDSTRDCSQECYLEPHILIYNTNECQIDCSQNSNSKIFGYQDKCYEACPKRTKISQDNKYICKEIICNKYYNYEENDCVDEIPKGYYLKNETSKTLGKCHSDCMRCYGEENINNTNCEKCYPNKFLYLRNCLDKCKNGYFTLQIGNSSENVCNCENIECK